MARLRDPNGGCPWDIEQDFASIAPYTIEEAYEVAEAIAHNDMPSLADELGDLLLQVVYHAEMAREANHFDFSDVVDGISKKMIRRHPHVFGDAEVKDAAAQTAAWEVLKAAERAEKATGAPSALDGVALGLPALTRAVKLQKRAARVGFDWGSIAPVMDKMREEIAELQAEIDSNAPKAKVEEEFGDLLFVMANLARHLDLEPETALRNANAKFERRFKAIESRLREKGERPEQKSLEQLDAEWTAVKALEPR
nr:nucleoside triphosphate pyrophosphohydrolase [Govania unica]